MFGLSGKKEKALMICIQSVQNISIRFQLEAYFRKANLQ